ncbi:MAG: glycosyltransferase family 2 protein [Nitrospira sp.]|nr:glycosyltransferase family 2 protein [Nitrospira sp.]
MPSISLVFPAYNEEENIVQAVKQAQRVLSKIASPWEIIVVNDGSKDRTREIIEKLSRNDSHVRPIHHPTNFGYGAALKSGISAAKYDFVFFCDSDLQFDLKELPTFLRLIKGNDIVIGYRAKRQDPFHRKANAWGWKMLIRLVLGLKVRDIDCAFKLFSREVFETIKIDAVGAMVNTDILVQSQRYGFKIKQHPVTHYPRLNGTQTGANIKVILKAFRELFSLYKKLKDIKPVNSIEYRKTNEAGQRFKSSGNKKVSSKVAVE